MTPKERMRAALRGDTPDCAPAAPGYLSLYRAEVEKREYVRQYHERMKGMTRYRPDHEEDLRFRAKAIYHAYDMFREKPDCIEVSPGPARAWAERIEIVREDTGLLYLDMVTGDRYAMLGSPFPSGRDYLYGTIPSAESDVWDRSELIQNRDVIDSIVRLVALEELEEQGVFDLPRRVVCDRGGEFFISIIDSTPYTATYLLGFQGLMLSFHDNPDNLKYFIERVMRQREPILRGYADAGYDGVYVEEIFSGADLISPQLFEEFVLPGNAEYFRTTRRFGLLTAYYMCGNPLPLIPEIVRLECDAVAFEESKKNLSLEIEEIVDRVGPDKCVFGNIDAPYHGLHASADAVKAEVERQIRAGQRAGGFVVSTGSPLPLETPAERIGMIIAAAHAHTLG